MLPAIWRPAVVLLALALAAVVVAVDLISGSERVVVGTLVLPVLLTALTLSFRWTAALAAVAVAGAAAVLLAVDVNPHPALRFVVLVVGTAACALGADRASQVYERARETADKERRYRTILDTADEGVGVLARDGRVVFANSRLAELLGVPLDRLVGRPATELLGGTGRQAFEGRVDTARAGRPTRQEIRHRRPDGRIVHLLATGRPLPGENGEQDEVVGFYTDITGRKRAEQELLRMALHDELTGLANRALLRDRLGHALARRDHEALAVLLLDLDQFKAVNDSLGHDAGDLLLQAVARRLLEAVRPSDTVARLGGDEFAFVCPDVGDVQGAEAVAERIEAILAEPIEVRGLEMTVTASIGLAVTKTTGDAETAHPDLPDRLLREADAAMYAAKRHGRARYEVYDTSMGEQASDRLRVLSELRAGLGRDELRVHYQPIIDIGSGSTRGVESLVRWQHPERGLLMPAEFLPAAEESGLLVDLGAWVLGAAARQGAAWQQGSSAAGPPSISVNLSVRQLLHRSLVWDVRAMLEESGLPPGQLTLEVTETALIADLGVASRVLDQLRELGVRLALDDFGTGYSSLAYLRHLPVNELKLDRSFLVDLEEPQSQAVVSAVIDVAHALDMTVVGEGVEHPSQLDLLGRLGCDLAQGYLCGRPAAAADLAMP
jgi:diguanylate cyclase (GGDEF)-like protein/PAS domain S-box-containing protein